MISENDDIWVRILIGTVLSIPFLPISNFLLTFLYMMIVSLYGMKLTHATSTYVNQVDHFVAISPRLYKKIPKFKPSTSDLSSLDRVKCTVQDAAVLLPIALIVSISAMQFSIFTVGANVQKLHIYCFKKFHA